MTNEYYPMQPLVEEAGVLRFERNPIVEMLVGRFGMNQIAIWCADHLPGHKYQEQLAQLIGYSTSGYCDLGYVSDASQVRVERAIKAFNDRLNGGLGALSYEEIANNLRVYIGLWDPVEVYVRKHPSVKLGVSVPEATLRLLREGDLAAKKLAAEHDARVQAEQALELADRLNEELIEQVATLKEYEQHHEQHVLEIRKLEGYIREIADRVGIPASMVPLQTKNRIIFALTRAVEILDVKSFHPDGLKRYAGIQARFTELQAKLAEALREKQAAVDRYQRDVYGLNNEGDPIGGEPAGGFANELKACREELEKLRAKEFVDFVKDGESAYLIKGKPAAPDENPHEWIIEKLSYHRFERDDLTIDECLSYLASEWKEVRGREVRPLVMQILALLASTPSHSQQSAEYAAFIKEVKEARRRWIDAYPTEDGRDCVTPFDRFLYADRCLSHGDEQPATTARHPIGEGDEFVPGDQLLNSDLTEADGEQHRPHDKPLPKFHGLGVDPGCCQGAAVTLFFSDKLSDDDIRELHELVASRFAGGQS